MKFKPTAVLSKVSILRRLSVLLTTAILMPAVGYCGLAVPYAPDASTLHLWHLDETTGNLCVDSQTTNTQTTPMNMVITPGQFNYPDGVPTQFTLLGQTAAFPNLGTAIQTAQFSCLYGPFTIATNTDGTTNFTGGDTSGCFPINTNISDYINTNTGAFTWEVIIQANANLFNPPYIAQILSGDSGFSKRSWQLRFAAGKLEYIDISATPTYDVTGALPTNGPDKFVIGGWYHLALTYTGLTPTNGDTPKVLTMYWTRLDPGRTNCDVLATFTKTNNQAGLTFLSIGGSGRANVWNNVAGGSGFYGDIDEIRMSSSCRKSNEMAFNQVVSANAPVFVLQPPATTLVGYGQSLTINATAFGSPTPQFVWTENGTPIPGQTNQNLFITNVTFAANGNYQCFASNSVSSTNSTVTVVTVGSTFDGLFNTGVDNNGNPLDAVAPGSIDQHYALTQSADPASTVPHAIVWGDQAPVSPNGGYAPNGGSVWIGPEENAGGTVGTYTFETTFLIDGGDVTTATMSGTVFAAGAAASGTLQVFINGVENDIKLSANTGGIPSAFTFTSTNGLQAGSNVLDFVVSTASGPVALNLSASSIGLALPAGPPTIASSPADQSIEFGSPASFAAVALGRPPLSYQWLLNGAPANPATVPGAQSRVLNLTAANGDLPGEGSATNYQVIVSNASGSITSSVATLTINDTIPLVATLAGEPFWLPTTNETQIVVLFSKAVNPTAAASASNYSLDNGATIVSAVIGDASNKVVLTTSLLVSGTAYNLTIANVQDLFGATMSPSPAIIAVGIYPALSLWLKADTGVTADSSGLVTQWNDLSGNNNTLTQPNGQPFEPQLSTNVLPKGGSVIQFTATNETYMEANDSPTLGLTGDMTIFAAMIFNGPIGTTNGMIVSKTTGNKASPYDYYANSTSGQFYRGNGATIANIAPTRPPATNTPQVLDVMMQGSAVTHRLNGAANGSGTINTTISDDSSQPLLIGTRVDTGNRLNGSIAELIIVGSSVSTNDRVSIENYLDSKYLFNLTPANITSTLSAGQLTLSWPVDHIGWRLQAQTNAINIGITTNWVTVPNSTSTNQVVIPASASSGSVFYRLIYP